MTWWRPDNGDLLLDILVQPRASRSRVVGRHDDRLKVAITAPPVDGGANRELVRLVAKLFGVGKSSVVIEKGLASRRKCLRVRGVARVPAELAGV